MKYNIHSSDNDIIKYIKMHVDDGLESLSELVEEKGILNGFDLIKSITWIYFLSEISVIKSENPNETPLSCISLIISNPPFA